ncbi:ABC transporter permease [Foetidibacter luteolus]|uniref:ABC transporter permease n=1 Tax=Foetidibacter luteolus TaxID=2608880 RepID=UPI00129BFAAF|nr:ABC transporter permease [Foetidibacter luteolus]
MIRNYIKVAWRNLLRNKTSSLINIGGLAIGMAVAILIGLWIYDELSFDKYHKNYERLARVMQKQTFNGGRYTQDALPFPLGKALQMEYGSDFKHVVMASWQGSHILSAGDKKLSGEGIYMDNGADALLSLKMLYGAYGSFKEPNSILLSASTAKAFFGNANPMGKLMKLDNKLNVKVTGVYEDLPYNTSFRDLDFISTWQLYASSEDWIKRSETEWGNNSFQAFVQLSDKANLATVNKRIANVKYTKVDEEDKRYKAEIFLHPMKDWHLRSKWEEGKQKGGLIEYVWLFLIVGIFVLVLACINFMNLSTARSEKRAKEVGIRKAVGSLRTQLIGQFYSESLLVVALSFVLSLAVVMLVLPWFNQVADKRMSVPWGNIWFWLSALAFGIFSGIIAGSYPALYLSSFQPVKVLKGTFRVGRFAALPRKVLVVVQFTISLALIIGTVVVYKQIQHTKNRPIGYDKNGVVMIEMKSPDFYGKFDVLRTELKGNGAIEEMSESSSPLTAVWSNNGGFNWEGKDPNLDADFATIWVTHEFGKTVGWQFKEGRDMSREFSTDSASVVMNEAAVKFMGIREPVGKTIRWGSDERARSYKVIGVIKDMLMQSPYEEVKQTFYFLDYNNVNWIILKLNGTKSVSESLAKIEAAFKKNIPSAPFEYQFADAGFAEKFAAEERVGKLSTFFAALAVLISCLGLFGLASFVAEQRTKEIGIRKVLGASVAGLWSMLSRDFVLLVIISCFIAGPLAYYYMHGWLQKYTYRTDISWWVFAATALGALLVTLLTVSFQSIKAALMNPVKSLRSE